MHAISWVSVVTFLVGVAGWIYSQLRRIYSDALLNPDGTPAIDETVTRPMLDMSKTCVRLSALIYDRWEDLHRVLAIDGWKVDEVIQSRDRSAVCAVLFRDDGPAPSCIVVWRGTSLLNRRQLQANRELSMTELTVNLPGTDSENFRYQIPGKVHSGLAAEFLSVSDPLLCAIRRHVRAGRNVYLTGHSQGAGLACVTVAAMRCMAFVNKHPGYYPGGLITFGCLRPGDAAFCDLVTESCTYSPADGEFGVLRYRNNNDIVPLLPLLCRGYRHAGDELYIWPNGAVSKNPVWVLKLIQHVLPYLRGIYGDGFADHRVSEYVKQIALIQIPEPAPSQCAGKC